MAENQKGDQSGETGLGLYIGRFQPFHNGHKKIVDRMLRENSICIILIGLSDDINKNPYSYWERLHFFTHSYPNENTLYIYPLSDETSDTQWIENILAFEDISAAKHINLYCGDAQNDSAIQVILTHRDMFPGEISLQEISRKELPISGTNIRKNIREQGLKSEKNNIPQDVYEYLKGDS